MSTKGCASTYIPSGAADYANSHKVSSSLGKCATYAKNALVSTGAGKINNNVYFGSVDACTISHWATYFGFQIVCSGDTRECPSGFEAQEGDLMVNAGISGTSDKTRYGHVSIYKPGVGWIADFASSGPGCYSANSGRNYWVIYRK